MAALFLRGRGCGVEQVRKLFPPHCSNSVISARKPHASILVLHFKLVYIFQVLLPLMYACGTVCGTALFFNGTCAHCALCYENPGAVLSTATVLFVSMMRIH